MQVHEVLRVVDITHVPGVQLTLQAGLSLLRRMVRWLDCWWLAAEVAALRQTEIGVAPDIGNKEHSKIIQGVVNRDDCLLTLFDLDKLLTGDAWNESASI